MTLLLLLLPLLVLLIGPTGFADGGGDVGGADAGGADGGEATGDGGGGGESEQPGASDGGPVDSGAEALGGRPAPAGGARGASAPPDDLRAATRAALEKTRGRGPGGAPPDPSAPAAPPPAPPKGGAEPGQVFGALGIDANQYLGHLTPEQRAIVEPLAADVLAKMYREGYEPVAAELMETANAQAAWQEQVNAWMQGEHYQFAVWLSQNPEAMQRLHAALSGEPAGVGEDEFDPAQLDPDQRRMHAAFDELRQQNAQLQQQLSEISSWREGLNQQETARRQAASRGWAEQNFNAALDAVKAKLGYDPSTYERQFGAALQIAGNAIEKATRSFDAWRQRGGYGPPPQVPEIGAVLWDALQAVGFEFISDRRKSAARTSSRAPTRGADPGAHAAGDLRAMTQRALEQSQAARAAG